MLPGVEFARKRRVHCHDANKRDPTKAPPASPLRRTASIDETAALALLRLEETLLGRRSASRSSRRRPSDHSPASSWPSPSTSSFSYPTSLGRLWNRHFKPRSSDGGRGGPSKNSSSKAVERTVSKIEVCAVCLDQVEANQRAMWLPCSHKFHSECVLPWLAAHPHCPCCRTHLPASDLPLPLL